MNITQPVRSITVFYFILLYLLSTHTITAEDNAQLNPFQNAPTTTPTIESNIPTILDQQTLNSLEENSATNTPLVKAAVAVVTTLVQNDQDDGDEDQDEEEEDGEEEYEEDEEDDDSELQNESDSYTNTPASTTTTTTTKIASIKSTHKPTTATTTASKRTPTTPVALPLVTEHSNKTLQYTNTSDPLVQYDLECEADDSFCSKVSRAVGAAIDEFSRVIYVKNSLLIKVRYYSFCEKVCANDTYGWGAPTSQFTLPFEDGADLNFVYPQALAKQLAPYSSTSVWAKYDIEIEINHDVYVNEAENTSGWNGSGIPPNGKFWFFNDTAGVTIQSHQVDLRYVVLHELLHGLGFLSSWAAYFYSDASPFRDLVDGVIDPLMLQLVTPSPYWYINQNTGPAYVTGFQPTMIFDKYLVSVSTELNVTRSVSLSELAFDMQDFCVQHDDAFIINFIRGFTNASQSTTAHKLWLSMSQPETVSFQFQSPTVSNSSYNSIPYLNKTYTNITLLTGGDLFARSSFERIDATLNRPGLVISHLDDQYATTPDFLMTPQYHQGQTLEDLVKKYYDVIPVIKYNTTSANNSMVEQVYRSPIGPGVLRILDSIGYSTVLTKTNYTTDGNVKTPKSRSHCDDSNTNHAKPSPTSSSSQIGRAHV